MISYTNIDSLPRFYLFLHFLEFILSRFAKVYMISFGACI